MVIRFTMMEATWICNWYVCLLQLSCKLSMMCYFWIHCLFKRDESLEVYQKFIIGVLHMIFWMFGFVYFTQEYWSSYASVVVIIHNNPVCIFFTFSLIFLHRMCRYFFVVLKSLGFYTYYVSVVKCFWTSRKSKNNCLNETTLLNWLFWISCFAKISCFF